MDGRAGHWTQPVRQHTCPPTFLSRRLPSSTLAPTLESPLLRSRHRVRVRRLPYAKVIAQLKANTRHVVGGIASQGIAAIENALLDVVGKCYGVPVCALFGGPYRTELPVYWSHCGSFRVSMPSFALTPLIPRVSSQLIRECNNASTDCQTSPLPLCLFAPTRSTLLSHATTVSGCPTLLLEEETPDTNVTQPHPPSLHPRNSRTVLTTSLNRRSCRTRTCW